MRPRIVFAPRFRRSAFLSDLRSALAEDDPGADASFRPVLLLGLPRLAVLLAPLLGDKSTLVLDGAEELDEKLQARLRNVRVASFCFETYSKLRRAGVDAAFFAWAPAPRAGDAPFRQGWFVEQGLEAQRRAALEDAFRLLSRPRWLAALSSLVGRPRLPQGVFRGAAAATPTGEAVYVASPKADGLDGQFLEAMAAGLVVYGPERRLFRQFITHGVSGLLAGRSFMPPADCRQAISGMARRVTIRARRRFDTDRQRLRAFVAGAGASRRTIAEIDWRPAPARVASPPTQAKEGGARTRGTNRADLPAAPLVTVAIVVRNARERFAPTLMSALAQDYPNLEIVVVDGASTDGTRDEIAARDEVLDYWISEADNGPYDGMNKAARLARGRFLIFMNAGDFFPCESAVSEAFEEAGTFDADVVIGHHIYVEASGVESLHKGASFEESWRNLCAGDISWEWLAGIPCGQAVFIRSQLLREQPFDPNYRIAADHAFLYEARRRGRRFTHCDSIIGVYTSGGLSGADDRKTSRELLRLARTYGPREKIDAWFRVNMPYAFDPD